VEGQQWSASLLPLQSDSEGRLCVDVESGRVVYWDRRAAKMKKAGAWQASFSVHASSLDDWLERWVDTPTVCEGGPPGGIVPLPSDESAAPVEQGPGEPPVVVPMAPISDDWMRRVVERAGDPRRRTYAGGIASRARPIDFGGLVNDLQRTGHPMGARLNDIAPQLGSLFGQFGVAQSGAGFVMTGAKPSEPAAAPSATDLASAEHELGFDLPAPLRQLYAISDGGFGPGDGLLPLTQIVSRYRELTRNPQGPLDQPWPANLLPLFEEDPVLICLDLATGAITAWDPEEIEDELDDADWQRSFKLEHASLEALMRVWVTTPTFEEAGR
jgi:hypothetical protein